MSISREHIGNPSDDLRDPGYKNSRLITRALRLGWDIPPEIKSKLLEHWHNVLSAPDVSEHQLKLAGQFLTQAEKVTVEALVADTHAREVDAQLDDLAAIRAGEHTETDMHITIKETDTPTE